MFFDREGLVSVAQRIGGASRVLTRSVAVPLTAAVTFVRGAINLYSVIRPGLPERVVPNAHFFPVTFMNLGV
jgi:hypothetical protein